MGILACAIATSCCISDVPSRWESQKFDPHCSDIFNRFFSKLKTKKDIRDMTLQNLVDVGQREKVCESGEFWLTIGSFFYLYSSRRVQITP